MCDSALNWMISVVSIVSSASIFFFAFCALDVLFHVSKSRRKGLSALHDHIHQFLPVQILFQ